MYMGSYLLERWHNFYDNSVADSLTFSNLIADLCHWRWSSMCGDTCPIKKNVWWHVSRARWHLAAVPIAGPPILARAPNPLHFHHHPTISLLPQMQEKVQQMQPLKLFMHRCALRTMMQMKTQPFYPTNFPISNTDNDLSWTSNRLYGAPCSSRDVFASDGIMQCTMLVMLQRGYSAPCWSHNITQSLPSWRFTEAKSHLWIQAAHCTVCPFYGPCQGSRVITRPLQDPGISKDWTQIPITGVLKIKSRDLVKHTSTQCFQRLDWFSDNFRVPWSRDLGIPGFCKNPVLSPKQPENAGAWSLVITSYATNILGQQLFSINPSNSMEAACLKKLLIEKCPFQVPRGSFLPLCCVTQLPI